MIPTYTEDDRYYFDEARAERPIKFIEKYCRHYEGRFAGKPFVLLAWQKQIVRTLFGWIERDTDLRRFRELYLITAKGTGKTPLIAAIGLYMLLADGEAGAHVISMASSYSQAMLTFSAGKNYVEKDTKLSRMCKTLERVIKAPKNSRWDTVSGKPNGRSGPRPSCIIADECHEWEPWTAKSFDMLCANLFKRSQPLTLIATNAAADKLGFAWTVHERALRVLADPSIDPQMLPVIFEASAALDWRSEEAAAAANPSMGAIVPFARIQPEQNKGIARYKRLYLSQWVTATEKWIDMEQYEQCIAPLQLSGTPPPLFVGVDLSGGDDLCTAAYVWATEERYHVAADFWLPRETAEFYDTERDVPYLTWAEREDITLLEETTITPEVQRMIAKRIIERAEGFTLKAVCYDRYRANTCISTLEAEGVICVPIAQGYTVSPGCEELSRRLKEGSISIAPSGPAKFCAENVEVKYDDRGNLWPVKPNAKNKYAGRTHAKIDFIAALVTAMVEARKHTFRKKRLKSKARAVILE